MARKPPTVQVLKTVLYVTKVRVVERATKLYRRQDGTWVRRTVRGTYNLEREEIIVGRRLAREWARADDMVLTVIHELLHRVDLTLTERWIKAHELEYFKNLELREAVAMRLLNVTYFPE